MAVPLLMQEGGRMGVSRLGVTAGVLILTVIAAFVAVSIGYAQEGEEKGRDWALLFDKTEVMIAARDGVKLHTEIYSPKDASEALPILMDRTPYGIASPDMGVSNMIYRYADMAPDGYIFVFQDIRGRYGSEGKLAMLRPIHDAKGAKGIDQRTDTFDSTRWLAQ